MMYILYPHSFYSKLTNDKIIMNIVIYVLQNFIYTNFSRNQQTISTFFSKLKK